MDDQARKEMLRKGFNAASAGYDRPALRFFHHSACHHADIIDLPPHARVLDLATGTGALALELAKRLPEGEVVGIDLSDGMLAQAQAKAEALGIRNARFEAMDMTALSFPDDHFDAITCAFGVFFVEDMAGLLRGAARVLKPGGRLCFSSFQPDLFHPMADLFMTRIEQYGIAIPPMTWRRVDDADKVTALLAEAGLNQPQAHLRDVSYSLEHSDHWWEIVWYAGYRGLAAQLAPDALERFKAEHLAEVGALADAQGALHLPIGALYGYAINNHVS
ncbi:class I SAM-dependent methyltransferase [Magnetofaba australis]|uniref:Putative type 11 methyltransferase n=1 Tax=Magnetofaba australis IT-1 TaxID=1434232 RepID=A0A1Y2K0D4_9PROT|nr:methyltransferase domain-containing protein [Magnetofaba australis]OSM01488.1 putative type 11 methyltransferase [Magnetofaba australis IT-1]